MRFSLFTVIATGTAILLPLISVFGQTAHEITRDEILATGGEWKEKYDQYDPVADMVDALKAKLVGDVRIDVYLGLWCPDSRNNVPLFIKIMDRAGTAVPVRYFDVPKKANKEILFFIDEFKVRLIPTFIFYRDDKEIDRIVENPKAGMIEDTMEIFFH